MIGAGMGKGLQRAVKTAGYQAQNPDEDLMTSVLRAYGFVPGKLGVSMPTGAQMPAGLAGIAGPNGAGTVGGVGAADAASGAAGGGGLLAGLKSL
jgi:hypothetical protein